MLSEAQQHALWGDLFEVSVKRGCLAMLRHRRLLDGDVEHLQPWRTLRVSDLHAHLFAQTGAVDVQERARLRSSLDHLLLAGWGLGWTVMREWLRRLPGGDLRAGGLFCPLALPQRRSQAAPDPAARVAALWQGLGLAGQPDPAWAARGEPANADLLLLARGAERQHLLCLEFSLHVPPDAEDFGAEAAHLAELEQYVRRAESRGVFTRIAAEVQGERFVFSDAVVSHLGALTTPDKPLYKLCQGSSYATRFLQLQQRRGQDVVPITAHVLAVTNAGIESLRARFEGSQDVSTDAPEDPRARLMATLGRAYRRASHPPDGDDQALEREIRAVQGQICRSLPPALRDQFEEALGAPPSTRRLDVRLRERLEDVVNPAAPMARDAALRWVDDAPEDTAALLGGLPRQRVAAQLDVRHGPGCDVSLRDLHAAAMLAGLDAAPPGRITVIAAEGHPGIGKTTAVVSYLRRLGPGQGFLFFYASLRTVINSDVTRQMAEDERGRPSGVLTLTTSSRLIGSAGAAGVPGPAAPGDPGRQWPPFVDAAVVAAGVEGLCLPAGSIRFLSTEDAQRLDEEHASSRFRRRSWDERLDVVETRHAPGVLFTLARAARGCLAANPALNRLVLTGAIQGYRMGDGGVSTVERLSELYHNPCDTPRGLRERRGFAERMGTVVVMVDEIAGDGAGAPFVHALASWLHRELIAPFDGEPETGSPFRVILVLADASLANDAVLASYLAHDQAAPEKVIVSGSHGPRPLRLAGGRLALGGLSLPALHLMADGFPARHLEVDYRVRLTPIRRPRPGAHAGSPRRAIREQHGQAYLRAAVMEICAALSRLPSGQQVILFAQDKALLRDVRRVLVDPAAFAGMGPDQAVETFGQRLNDDQIGLLDSSVAERERRLLIQPAVRDAKRVFLMTSSGARGISFPHASTLIAFVPSFAVESGFMEIAQLIYRGRGKVTDKETNAVWDGDLLDRRIVLLLQDFVLDDEEIDHREWLRRTVDLVSALVLLRATILTRVTGDAHIPGQQAAIVPVGRIGQEELETSLAQSVAAFLREGAIALHDRLPAHHRARVERAVRCTEELFRELRLTGRAAGPQTRSVSSPDVLREVAEAACSPWRRLLSDSGGPPLPDRSYALGAVWLEAWTGIRAEEAFRFHGAYTSRQEALRSLLGNCRAIERDPELPGPLRRAARDVVDIVQRSDELLGVTFVTRRRVGSRRLWVSLPLDYQRFCQLPPGEAEDGGRFHLAEPERWLELLGRAATTNAAAAAQYPVLPSFDGRPFVALSTYGDPTGLERAFDDRYFVASSELNLLNTILLVAEA